MKINDIITETRGMTLGDVPEHQKPIMQKTINFRDLGGFDRTHHIYRIMMACAMSDGKNLDKLMTDMDPLAWHSKYNTAHPYTEEELAMMQDAIAAMGADWNMPVKTGQSELPEVNRKSTHRQVGAITLNKKKK